MLLFASMITTVLLVGSVVVVVDAAESSGKDDHFGGDESQQNQQIDQDTNDEDDNQKIAIKDRNVRSVLRAAKRNNLYGILGIRNNWSLKVPSRDINVAGLFSFTIPGFTIKQPISDKTIKRKYRKRAVQVHPDKHGNHPDANDAFVAVENAASILMDGPQRKLYDEQIRRHREETIQLYKHTIIVFSKSVWYTSRNIATIVKTFLGPFFIPVLIIGCIII